MGKCKEVFNRIKQVILSYNIHIWALVIILFVISIFGMRVVSSKKVKYPKYLAVTGDSYAGFLITYENLRDYGMLGYAVAGKTLEENFNRMQEAMHQNLDIVVISIGVNDVYNDTDPEKFERLFHSLLLEGYKYGKTIITHSYMDFMLNHDSTKWKPYIYDAVIRKEMYEFDNAYYIDMKDCEKEEYLQKDNIHYNKMFYDVLYDRLKTVIDNKYFEEVRKLKRINTVDIYMLFMSIFALLLAVLTIKLTKGSIIKINNKDNLRNDGSGDFSDIGSNMQNVTNERKSVEVSVLDSNNNNENSNTADESSINKSLLDK